MITITIILGLVLSSLIAVSGDSICFTGITLDPNDSDIDDGPINSNLEPYAKIFVNGNLIETTAVSFTSSVIYPGNSYCTSYSNGENYTVVLYDSDASFSVDDFVCAVTITEILYTGDRTINCLNVIGSFTIYQTYTPPSLDIFLCIQQCNYYYYSCFFFFKRNSAMVIQIFYFI